MCLKLRMIIIDIYISFKNFNNYHFNKYKTTCESISLGRLFCLRIATGIEEDEEEEILLE